MHIYNTHIVSFLNLIVISTKHPSSFWFETCLNWVSGYQPSELAIKQHRNPLSMAGWSELWCPSALMLAFCDEKEGSRDVKVIISSKHPKWLFVIILFGWENEFECRERYIIYLYIWNIPIYHDMPISVPWFSLPVGVPSVNLGGCSEATKRKWWPFPAGGRWQEAPFWGGLETTWYHDIPWYLEGEVSVSRCFENPGFLAFGVCAVGIWKSTFAGETTFHPWIQHGIGTDQSQLWEEHLSPFSRPRKNHDFGRIWDICQTSTYLVFQGCYGICSTLALPGQFRANLLQGTLRNWGVQLMKSY